MSMNVGGESDEVMSTINTTPLVDVMLVMLIIFLITIPVIVPSVKVNLPEPRNLPIVTKPENIPVSVDVEGNIYWKGGRLENREEFLKKRYEHVARLLYSIQQAAIVKVSFLTEPKGHTE
jgi:biopolymer transport protein ExbD